MVEKPMDRMSSFTERFIYLLKYFKWVNCLERGKYVNENGENAGFELEDSDEDFQWVEDWQLKQKEGSDGWEYSLAWGNPFSNNAEGSFVRRKVHIKKREKIMKG